MTITTTGTKRMQPYNKVAFQLADGEYEFDKSIGCFPATAKINTKDYALVHNLRVQNGNAILSADSAISMVQGFNGKDYLGTHRDVIRQGLSIPTPARFMPHLRNVNLALEGKGVLYDANGNLIEGDRLKDYADTMNHNSWAWLNAGFSQGKGFRNLDLAIVNGLDSEGNSVYSRVPLEDCLEKDCWADLESLNLQGFPTKKSPTQSYEPGKTIYFTYPRQDAVAGFNVDSDWAGLICYWNPVFHSDSLGVFASTEGASSEKIRREN